MESKIRNPGEAGFSQWSPSQEDEEECSESVIFSIFFRGVECDSVRPEPPNNREKGRICVVVVESFDKCQDGGY